MAACRHLATAARVKYPAALQRCKFDTPLLAAGSLIVRGRIGDGECENPPLFHLVNMTLTLLNEKSTMKEMQRN